MKNCGLQPVAILEMDPPAPVELSDDRSPDRHPDFSLTRDPGPEPACPPPWGSRPPEAMRDSECLCAALGGDVVGGLALALVSWRCLPHRAQPIFSAL